MRYYYLYEQEEFIKLLKDVGFKVLKVFLSVSLPLQI